MTKQAATEPSRPAQFGPGLFGPGQFGARSGHVASYDVDAGLGVVQDLSGDDWMFHCTTIADGSRTIEAGLAVTFDVRPGGPGRFEAFDVTPAPET